MRINSIQQQTYHKPPSFGSKRLYEVGLKFISPRNIERKISGFFTKLEKEDLNDILNIQEIWAKTKYGKYIVSDYLKHQTNSKQFFPKSLPKIEFYAIEQAGSLSPISRIKSLAKIINHKNFIEINCIQSESQINKNRKIKGGGELMLYGIVKKAKDTGRQYVFLSSTADEWYKKQGWTHSESNVGSLFCINNENFDKFLKKIEEKYNFI